ncbi:thioredoxin domain-containing protein, partial [Candidatus Woesearchaeota archaeon]|nr:thioredoxin domain-containing protein [Candidatus Woesearchaeota archaeon]
KNHHIKEKVIRSNKEEPKSEKTENIVALSVFAFLMIIILALFTNGFGLYNPNVSKDRINVPIGPDDAIRGNATYPQLVVVVYSEFECPFCKRGEDTMMELFNKYNDNMVFVFKHFPLTSIHPHAFNASVAVECAGEQGKFWEYHDTLFSHNTMLSPAELKAYAKELGLDEEQFNHCLDTGKYAFKVLSDVNEGRELGVSSTPTFFINGIAILGAQPASEFEKVISKEIE